MTGFRLRALWLEVHEPEQSGCSGFFELALPNLRTFSSPTPRWDATSAIADQPGQLRVVDSLPIGGVLRPGHTLRCDLWAKFDVPAGPMTAFDVPDGTVATRWWLPALELTDVKHHDVWNEYDVIAHVGETGPDANGDTVTCSITWSYEDHLPSADD